MSLKKWDAIRKCNIEILNNDIGPYSSFLDSSEDSETSKESSEK